MSGAELSALLEEHRKLAQHVARKYDGLIFKEMGDSFFIAFDSATSAVSFAVEFQKQLAVDMAGRIEQSRIEIRACINTGDVLIQGADFFGEPVNLTARMEPITPGNEIYVSDTTASCINSAEFKTELVGAFKFKGIPKDVKVYRMAYQHATRIIPETCIFISDIMGFSRFANTRCVDEVEKLLDRWDEIHREIVSLNEGAIQVINADRYFCTFPSATAGYQAFLQLRERVTEAANSGKMSSELEYLTAMDYGELKIYRTNIYGLPTNRAEYVLGLGNHHNLAGKLLAVGDAYDRLNREQQESFQPWRFDDDQGQKSLEKRQIKSLFIFPKLSTS